MMICPNSSGDGQASGSAHRVGELLSRWNGFAANLAGGVDRVLRLDGADDFGNRDVRFASLSGLTQQRMAYCPAPKTETEATPGIRVSASLRLMVA